MNRKKQMIIKQSFLPGNQGQNGGQPNLPAEFFEQFSPYSPSQNSGSKFQSVLNKFGGIDGIVSTIGKVQQLFQTLAPILPIIGSLLKRKRGSKKSKSFAPRRNSRKTRRKGVRNRKR